MRKMLEITADLVALGLLVYAAWLTDPALGSAAAGGAILTLRYAINRGS